ncbi:hypothetical protein K933_02926 [Candidatus Halobonum tyrrellensis G22]|uniref:Uncharacterized protein n=1 Tax=Candidatus Halobonum tyrrellensis G22 TaxID=1324957 RepID=V4GWS9_9EURY|nr:hypothetical protein K933_02926 [Candidatus Halobonum tyrrellensis G22]
MASVRMTPTRVAVDRSTTAATCGREGDGGQSSAVTGPAASRADAREKTTQKTPEATMMNPAAV